jgi:hypothetical protein
MNLAAGRSPLGGSAHAALLPRERTRRGRVLPLPVLRTDRGAGPAMQGQLEPILEPLRAAFEAERLQALEA